jgi:hypothetical protein
MSVSNFLLTDKGTGGQKRFLAAFEWHWVLDFFYEYNHVQGCVCKTFLLSVTTLTI